MRAAVAPRLESRRTAPVVELEFSTDRALGVERDRAGIIKTERPILLLDLPPTPRRESPIPPSASNGFVDQAAFLP